MKYTSGEYAEVLEAETARRREKEKQDAVIAASIEEADAAASASAAVTLKKRTVFGALAMVFVFMGILAMSVTLSLNGARTTGGNKILDNDALKIGAAQKYSFECLHSAVSGSEDMLIFDRDEIFDAEEAWAEIYIKNTNLTLSYFFRNMTVSIHSDHNVAFKVDYRIRLVERYDFNEYEDYPVLSDENPDFYMGETRVKYKFAPDGASVYLRFAYGGCEYFLCVKEIKEKTPLTKENLTVLLEALIP
jgi:hypothetical protein